MMVHRSGIIVQLFSSMTPFPTIDLFVEDEISRRDVWQFLSGITSSYYISVHESGPVRSSCDPVDVPPPPRLKEPHYTWHSLTGHPATSARLAARRAWQSALWLPPGPVRPLTLCSRSPSDRDCCLPGLGSLLQLRRSGAKEG